MILAVRHAHLRNGAPAEIRIGESSIGFRETGKQAEHSREWPYDEIQRLYVSLNAIRVLTYEDITWKLGRDREYEFDRLAEGAAQTVLAAVRGRIDDRRLVVAVPDFAVKPVWQVKAKLLRGGSNGTVVVGEDEIAYQTAARDAARTWSFRQIENISSSGPFDLTITTFERAFRFQLKKEMDENQYNRLWRRISLGEHK